MPRPGSKDDRRPGWKLTPPHLTNVDSWVVCQTYGRRTRFAAEFTGPDARRTAVAYFNAGTFRR